MDKTNITQKEQFERFFFYGIENKEEVKEGIIYFSTGKIYKDYSCSILYNVPNEIIESQIILESSRKYKHFYRFVTLNDFHSDNYTMDVDIDTLKAELEAKMEQLKMQKKVNISKAGVFFTRERSQELEGDERYVYGEGLKGEKGWTKQIYEILEKLEKLEMTDSNKYYEYWLLTKYTRAMNRQDEQEALKIKKIIESLREKEDTER